MASKWRDFGNLINLQQSEMDGWEQASRDTNHLWEKVMDAWLTRGHEEYKPNWAGLLEMLKDANLAGIAAGLKNALCKASQCPG